MSLCFCGSTREFKNCCEPLLENQFQALSAEALMRSRYTAFVLKKIDYLIKTHDPKTRAEFDQKSNEAWARSVVFTKLEILKSEEFEDQGFVEFKAYYTEISSAKNCVHYEKSQFRREAKTWYFVRGDY